MELSSDKFAKRKSYQIFTNESKTFLRRRTNGKSISENRKQPPAQKKPPLARRGSPSNKYLNRCLSRPHERTTPNHSSNGSCTVAYYAANSPSVTMARLIFPSKKNYPIPWTNPQTQLPASSLDPFDLPSQTASISDQPFCHNTLEIQTVECWRVIVTIVLYTAAAI